jgi:hypothetical protein
VSDATRNPTAPATDRTETGETLRQTGREIREAAGEVRAQAGEAASRAGGEAKALGEEALAEGREIAAAAADRAEGLAEEQKRAGADQAEGIARAIRRAADELQDTTPVIAGYVRDGADYVQQTATALRRRSVRELVGGVEGFAREQPAAFFGAAVLAGFALSRFIKSSADGGTTRYAAGRHGSEAPRTTATGAPGWTPDDDRPQPSSHPATMAAATLGGSAARSAGSGSGAEAAPPGGHKG